MAECRIMPTRRCPQVYGAEGCKPPTPCARFESDDETPWLAEVLDDLVWVAAVRHGITYHHIDRDSYHHQIDLHGLATLCGRSMRHGQTIGRLRATQELAGEPCPRCQTAAGGRVMPPADGTATEHARPFPREVVPAPAPAPPVTGAGVTQRGGAAATSPTAAPHHTPARAAATNSDSGCPGGHHNPPEALT